MIRRTILSIVVLLSMFGVLMAKTKGTVSSAVPVRVGGVVAFRDGNDVVAYFSLYDKNDREVGANGSVSITLRLAIVNAPDDMFEDCAYLCLDKSVTSKDFQQKMIGSGIYRSSRKIFVERRVWDDVKLSEGEDFNIRSRTESGQWFLRAVVEFTLPNGNKLANYSNVNW